MPNSSANINFIRSPKFNFLSIKSPSPEAKFERVLPLPPIVASYSGRSPTTKYKWHNGTSFKFGLQNTFISDLSTYNQGRSPGTLVYIMNTGDNHHDVSSTLPSSLSAWKNIDPFNRHSNPAWWTPWETLRPFFESRGFVLFKAGGLDGELSVPQPTKNGYLSPAAESFGLYGDRESFRSTFSQVISCCNHFHGARFNLFH